MKKKKPSPCQYSDKTGGDDFQSYKMERVAEWRFGVVLLSCHQWAPQLMERQVTWRTAWWKFNSSILLCTLFCLAKGRKREKCYTTPDLTLKRKRKWSKKHFAPGKRLNNPHGRAGVGG